MFGRDKRIDALEKKNKMLEIENEFMRKEIEKLEEKNMMLRDELALFKMKLETLEDEEGVE